jgi:hypothetical protein
MLRDNLLRQIAKTFLGRKQNPIPLLEGQITPALPLETFQERFITEEEIENSDWFNIGLVTGKFTKLLSIECYNPDLFTKVREVAPLGNTLKVFAKYNLEPIVCHYLLLIDGECSVDPIYDANNNKTFVFNFGGVVPIPPSFTLGGDGEKITYEWEDKPLQTIKPIDLVDIVHSLCSIAGSPPPKVEALPSVTEEQPTVTEEKPKKRNKQVKDDQHGENEGKILDLLTTVLNRLTALDARLNELTASVTHIDDNLGVIRATVSAIKNKVYNHTQWHENPKANLKRKVVTGGQPALPFPVTGEKPQSIESSNGEATRSSMDRPKRKRNKRAVTAQPQEDEKPQATEPSNGEVAVASINDAPPISLTPDLPVIEIGGKKYILPSELNQFCVDHGIDKKSLLNLGKTKVVRIKGKPTRVYQVLST